MRGVYHQALTALSTFHQKIYAVSALQDLPNMGNLTLRSKQSSVLISPVTSVLHTNSTTLWLTLRSALNHDSQPYEYSSEDRSVASNTRFFTMSRMSLFFLRIFTNFRIWQSLFSPCIFAVEDTDPSLVEEEPNWYRSLLSTYQHVLGQHYRHIPLYKKQQLYLPLVNFHVEFTTLFFLSLFLLVFQFFLTYSSLCLLTAPCHSWILGYVTTEGISYSDTHFLSP